MLVSSTTCMLTYRLAWLPVILSIHARNFYHLFPPTLEYSLFFKTIRLCLYFNTMQTLRPFHLCCGLPFPSSRLVRTHPSCKSSTTGRSLSADKPVATENAGVQTYNEVMQANSPAVSLVTQSVAYRPASETNTVSPLELPDSEPPVSSVGSIGRPKLRTELSLISTYSITSDDLMLDTDPGWPDSADEELGETSPSSAGRFSSLFDCQRDAVVSSTTRPSPRSRGHVTPLLSRESSLAHTRLESVTEASHDDLTRIAVSKIKNQTEAETKQLPTPVQEIGGHAVVQLRSKPDPSDKSMDSTAPDRRRHTTAFGDSSAKSLFSGLR